MAISKTTKSKARRRPRRSASLSIQSPNPIDRIASERLLSRGEIVFRKGQFARHIYKVENGCVRTYIKLRHGRRFITAFYFPGDYFGVEMRSKHNVSAEAITPSKVLAIGRKALISLAATDSAVANEMLRITNVELHRAQSHSLLLRNSADGRVANFLLEMKKRNRSREVDLLMSRHDIADYLNLTIETVSRALARLERSLVISFLTHRRVTVNIRKPVAA